jgi:hypothetical protein
MRLLASVLFVPLLVACGSDEAVSSDGSEVVAGIGDLADRVTVQDDQLEFDPGVFEKLESNGIMAKLDAYVAAADKSTAEPVIFVGNRRSDALDSDGTIRTDSRNGLGYLRKAVSYERASDGRLIVKTEKSDIIEAAKELQRSGFLNITDGPSAGVGTSSVHALADTAPPTTKSLDKTFAFAAFDKSNVTLFSLKDKKTSAELTVKLKTVNLAIKPRFRATFEAGESAPKKGSVYISGQVDGQIEIEATAGGELNLDTGGDFPSLPAIGGLVEGVPVSLSVDLKWKCGFSAGGKATASIGAKATGTLNRVGAEWDGTSITPVLEAPTYGFDAIGPTLQANAKLGGSCHLIPTVRAQLFDVIGPFASIDLWTKVDVSVATVGDTSGDTNPGTASLFAGGDLILGGGLRPFGFDVFSFSLDPIPFGPHDKPIVTTQL